MKKKSSVRKRANIYFFSKIAVNVLLMIVGAIFISLFLQNMQKQVSAAQQQQDAEDALEEVISSLQSNAQDADDLSKIFHDGNQDTLEDLKALLTGGMYDEMAGQTREQRTASMADILDRSGVSYLLLTDEGGKVLLAPVDSFVGTSLVERGLLSGENLAQLTQGTRGEDGGVTPVREDNDTGSYYFYSVSVEHDTGRYILILGADVGNLDLQIGALRDISAILRRAAVANDGFVFAVDDGTGEFLFYENGDEVLTGQNAAENGLSDQALLDGYAGVENINGTSYYCVSRTYNGHTVICAAASAETVFSADRYVVFWSVLGYILVMILCLAYAVIVRNSFVRETTKTLRKKLFRIRKTTLIVDISILRSVFPLILLGCFVIFGISFYTQTLLGISDAVENSRVALKEVSARFAENSENRALIQEYYLNHYKAKAELLAYLLEEDPTFLNEESDRYHTSYGEAGNRSYIPDDEGNPTKSVAQSAVLRKLCADNDLDAIYVYDEDGRTIATSTDIWYFVISFTEGDQSYAFRDVLDGRTDTLVQEAMTDEVGDASQYIGVAFYYYTTTDENGDTLYVSRYDYEHYLADRNAAAEEEEAEDLTAPVTRHRSLLQIAVSQEVTARVMTSTDVSYVLSSNALNGGGIVLFDSDEEHTLLYSPIESSVGKAAAELGISDKAFGDIFYGFHAVNGARYFLYFTYSDGYYIATAIPESGMFPYRIRVSLISAAVSLAMILILSATVMLTTDEEEELYRRMNDRTEHRGLNAAVFRILLPSGQRSSTVSAAVRWNGQGIPWREKGNDQKLGVLLRAAFGVVFLLLLLTMFGSGQFFGSSSVITYILNGGWERGLNIFACSASFALVVFTILVVSLLQIPVRMLTSLLGTRSETIGHLMLSVIKYGGSIGCLFYCLYLLGLDASSLLASAGILSLVVGLGAQSLIKDILAGIFIVFEGEFRVGDIITIGDFRGQVVDIGLRTTKVLNFEEGNTRIYNNSEISGVINMTKAASWVKVSVCIDYGQDMDYVRETFERELALLQKKDPRLLAVPAYCGISALADSGVTLLFKAQCEERNVNPLRIALNGYILDICVRNGISVAYNVMSITQLDTDFPHPARKEGEEASQ